LIAKTVAIDLKLALSAARLFHQMAKFCADASFAAYLEAEGTAISEACLAQSSLGEIQEAILVLRIKELAT
jgi:hypothetical protein